MQTGDTSITDSLTMERMLHAIEGSLKVSRRVHFFLWSQGALQGLLPHDMLLCVFGDFVNTRFKFDFFSQTKVDQEVIDKLTDPVEGLLHRIIQDWLDGERIPCRYSVKPEKPSEDPLHTYLRRIGYDQVIAHGAREIQGSESSFFIFFQKSNINGTRSAETHLLDMVMPHLHMALYRMLPNERNGNSPEISPESILSTRELEVLHWVREGKTNHDIGQVLQISPLTVKNHVQSILRKLNVSNRAQAVAKGQSSHLFGSFSPALNTRAAAD